MRLELIDENGQDYTNDPILSILCKEPEGEYLRRVWPFNWRVNNATYFYERAKKYPTLYGRDISRDLQQFQDIFFTPNGEGRGLFWAVDDLIGMFYLTDIVSSPYESDPPLDALVHYTFFDGRTRGRRDLTKAMIKYVFDKYKFNRLSAEVPKYALKYDPKRVSELNPAGLIPPFIESLGFKLEGTIRDASFYKGKYFDLYKYGFLKEDMDKWAPLKQQQ